MFSHSNGNIFIFISMIVIEIMKKIMYYIITKF